MKEIIFEGDEKKQLIAQGLHGAVIQDIFYIGTHLDQYTDASGAMGDPKEVSKVIYKIEALETIADDEPVSHTFYVERNIGFFDKSTFRKDYEKILNAEIQIGQSANQCLLDLLKAKCLIDVKHKLTKKNTNFAKIENLLRHNPNFITPEVNPNAKVWDIDWDKQMPKLPEWVIDRIHKAQEPTSHIQFVLQIIGVF